MTPAQKHALRVLYYFDTPQTKDSIPADLKRDPDWMTLTDHGGIGHTTTKWWETRDRLWNELKPLIGEPTPGKASSVPAPKKPAAKKKR